MTLERMVGRLGVDTFLNDYLDKRPVVIQSAGDFSDWFSYDAMDELVSSRGLRHPTFRLAADSQVVPPQAVSVGAVPWGPGVVPSLARPEALYDQMARGTSLVFDDLARMWEPVARGARSLEETFHATAFASSFYTPAKSQAFRPHYDIHQTFLVQCEGAKHWKVWGQHVTRPLRHQKCPPEGSPTEGLLIDQPLEKGDVLYIPRGFVHAGQTLDTASLHISYVVTPFTWFEVLRNALKNFDDPLLDQAVPLDARREVALSDEDDEAFDAMLERFQATVSAPEAFDRLARVFVRSRRFLSRGLQDLATPVGPHTLVQRRSGVIHRVVDGVLAFHNAELPIPAEHLTTVLAREPFEAARVGVELSQTLVDEGFLEVVR